MRPDCTNVQVTPAARTIAAGGGSATLAVAAPGGCSWNASSNMTWLQLTGATSGTGAGSLTVTAAANNSIDARNGSVSVGGSTATITQNGITPGNCGGAYTISPAARSSAPAGGVFFVTVGAAADCAWTYTSNVGWITLGPPTPGMNPALMPGATDLAGGVGPGTVEVTVAANTSTTARTGTAAIAGQTLTITQDGTASAVCAYSVSPGTLNFYAAGASAAVTITTTANCSWSLDVSSSAEDWVHGYRGVRGTGTLSISLTVDPNNTMTSRSGVVWVYPDSNGDRVSIVVNQAAATCFYGLAPTQASFTASGGQAWLSVSTTPSGCSWQATTSSAWITIVSGASGAGTGTVTYSVAANSGAARSGSVVVAGLSGVNPPATQRVTQAAAGIR